MTAGPFGVAPAPAVVFHVPVTPFPGFASVATMVVPRRNCTRLTPPVVVAESTTEPLTVDAAAGAVTVTTLLTVTLTGADVDSTVLQFALPQARAVMTLAPLFADVVAHVLVHPPLADVSVATTVPSTRNCIRFTPLVVASVAESGTAPPTVAPFAGAVTTGCGNVALPVSVTAARAELPIGVTMRFPLLEPVEPLGVSTTFATQLAELASAAGATGHVPVCENWLPLVPVKVNAS